MNIKDVCYLIISLTFTGGIGFSMGADWASNPGPNGQCIFYPIDGIFKSLCMSPENWKRFDYRIEEYQKQGYYTD